MGYANIFKCLCDGQRLRILNLLQEGPLCVCHLVKILESDQVKISKQLRYMKELGIVNGERVAQWMVYRLSDADDPLLIENLKCLRQCAGEELSFAQDREKRSEILEQIRDDESACAAAIV